MQLELRLAHQRMKLEQERHPVKWIIETHLEIDKRPNSICLFKLP